MREGKENVVIEKEEEIDYDEINRKIGLNNVKVDKQPILTISSWCHNRIKSLHKKYPNEEWLAWCKVEPLGEGRFIMTDMIHPQQKTTSGDVEITDDGMDWLVDYLIEQGEDLGKWNCVLHSHHHMGCFWSSTDDKARQSLNDGRSLAWAVVSAYRGEEIDYKGCVNFYKPYPIEIDCSIEYEIDDLYGQSKEWGDFLVKREKEIYNGMVATDEKLQSLQCEYDYSRIIDYLGIDITKELKDNSKVVSMKMPCEEYEERLKEIQQEAKEKAQEETGAPIDNELTQRMERNEFLDQQLEDAKVVSYKSSNNLGNFGRWEDDWDLTNSWQNYKFKDDEEEEKEKVSYEERKRTVDTTFNKFNFPTVEDLVKSMGFDTHFEFKLDSNGDWQVMNYSYYEPFWEYVCDVVSDLYQYPEDYLPRYEY